VKSGKQTTFINGKWELEGTPGFSSVDEGQTSIGVRQNRISWFKGAPFVKSGLLIKSFLRRNLWNI